MKRYIVLSFFVIAMAILGKSVLFSEETPITPTVPCPCNVQYTGYYFMEQSYLYKPVFFTNMPIDQFVGYTIMDSIITYAAQSYPTLQSRNDFFENLTCEGDTLNYALKYLYRLADYNPFLYYNFLTSPQAGKQPPMSILPKLLDRVQEECDWGKYMVVKSDYILHLHINNVDKYSYLSVPEEIVDGKVYPAQYGRLDYIFSKVIDTIKGQVLPDMSTGLTVFDEDSSGILVKRATPLSFSAPTNTDFLFYYNPTWTTKNKKGNVKPSMGGKAQNNKEYIVFAWIMTACRNNSTTFKQYYEIRPTISRYNAGIFPIVDGVVIDEYEDFGWGTEIPLSTFKQKLQQLIDSIKNYDE